MNWFLETNDNLQHLQKQWQVQKKNTCFDKLVIEKLVRNHIGHQYYIHYTENSGLAIIPFFIHNLQRNLIFASIEKSKEINKHKTSIFAYILKCQPTVDTTWLREIWRFKMMDSNTMLEASVAMMFWRSIIARALLLHQPTLSSSPSTWFSLHWRADWVWELRWELEKLTAPLIVDNQHFFSPPNNYLLFCPLFIS